MHPEAFDAIADSLNMTGKGRDAAKDVLTAAVGTLSAAAKRHGISRPAVARQVKRIQTSYEAGQVEVTLSLSLAELEALFTQRDQNQRPTVGSSETIVSRAERQLLHSLGLARPGTKGAGFYGSPDRLVIIDRQRHTAIHAWVSCLGQLSSDHPELEIISRGSIAEGMRPPAHVALSHQKLITNETIEWTYTRSHSLAALSYLLMNLPNCP